MKILSVRPLVEISEDETMIWIEGKLYYDHGHTPPTYLVDTKNRYASEHNNYP